MKFSNLDLQEIQKTGAAYIPVSLTYVRRESPRLQPWDERRVPRICASN